MTMTQKNKTKTVNSGGIHMIKELLETLSNKETEKKNRVSELI